MADEVIQPAAPAPAPAPVAAPAAPAPAAPAPAAPAAAAPAPAPEPAPASAPAPAAEPAPAAPAPEPAKDAAPAREFAPTAMESGAEPAKADAPTDKPAEPGKDAPAKPDAKVDAKPEAKAGDKPADAKDASATKDAPGAEPQALPSYDDLKFPDHVKPESLNQDRFAAFKELAGKRGMATEEVQQLVDLHIAEINDAAKMIEDRVSKNQWDVFQNQQTEWLSEIKADPVLGGSRFQTAMRTCAKVIEQYPGSQEERTALWNDLRATGMGNSPRFARLFHWLGETYFTEGGPAPAPAPRAPVLSGQQRGEARYAGSTPRR